MDYPRPILRDLLKWVFRWVPVRRWASRQAFPWALGLTPSPRAGALSPPRARAARRGSCRGSARRAAVQGPDARARPLGSLASSGPTGQSGPAAPLSSLTILLLLLLPLAPPWMGNRTDAFTTLPSYMALGRIWIYSLKRGQQYLRGCWEDYVW